LAAFLPNAQWRQSQTHFVGVMVHNYAHTMLSRKPGKHCQCVDETKLMGLRKSPQQHQPKRSLATAVDVWLECTVPVTKLKVKLIDARQSVGHSVLVLGEHLGPVTHFSFFLKISFKQLRVCCPLWREDGSIIYSYNCFWTLPEKSLSDRSPADLTTIFYCPFWDSPNLEGQVSVFISPRKRVAQLYPRALCSLFVASYDSQGCGGDF
jgi:hypothetical protein